jgi:lipid II:glycine glycyltransferase (peptidoglycan interpeptide bridge formation enzyme)
MEPVTNSEIWNTEIGHLPGTHLLQTWQWGEIKAAHGWEPYRFFWKDSLNQVVAAAQILHRRLRVRGFALNLSVLYVPRGPLLDWSDSELTQRVLDDLQKYAHQAGAIFIKMDPELVLGTGIPDEPESTESEVGLAVLQELTSRGWLYSSDQIQFRNSVWVDISDNEDVWLSRLKQKTRYNYRLAVKKGVLVRAATRDEFDTLYEMYRETAVRDGFVIRPKAYYINIWQTYLSANMLTPLVAEVNGRLVAGLMLFYFAGKSWYLYGMSRADAREWMPNYLLQYSAMQHAKSVGCHVYDMWGAPDVFDETDSMWGVFRFKEGWGGTVVRTLGAYDYTPSPLLYSIYTRVLPKILDVMRKQGKKQNQRKESL